MTQLGSCYTREIKCDLNDRTCLRKRESIVGKAEKVVYHLFLLFFNMFSESILSRLMKMLTVVQA